MPGRMAVLVLIGLLGSAEPARADARPYRGPHPVTADGPWHLETRVHVHDTLPVGEAPFASLDGVLVFLGDPRAFGYTGEIYAFDGAHPLPPRWGPAYCGITGAHSHPFAPEGEYRVLESGTYVFVGTMRGGPPTLVPGRLEPTAAEQAQRDREAGIPVLDGESTDPDHGNAWYFWYAPPPFRPCPRPPCRPSARPPVGSPPSAMRPTPPRPPHRPAPDRADASPAAPRRAAPPARRAP